MTSHDWAKSMDEARQLIVQFMQTREYEDAVFSGIGLDDNVHWPSSRITACLCETETMLAQVGVDAFFETIRWIAKTYPE